MIDRLFTAVLTFALLVGGTLAIGSALLEADPRSSAAPAARSQPRVVQLERVTITATRERPVATVAQHTGSESAARSVE